MMPWRALLIWVEMLGNIDTTALAALGVVMALLARRNYGIAAR